MIETLHIIVIIDAEYRQCSAVCGGMSDTIMLKGKDARGREIVFGNIASEARHWAEDRGFRYTHHTVKLDVDAHEVEDWTQEGYVLGAYDPNLGDDVLCTCGHPYDRHFDSHDDNQPVGCKYCDCETFKTP